jgi:hypothetical protein
VATLHSLQSLQRPTCTGIRRRTRIPRVNLNILLSHWQACSVTAGPHPSHDGLAGRGTPGVPGPGGPAAPIQGCHAAGGTIMMMGGIRVCSAAWSRVYPGRCIPRGPEPEARAGWVREVFHFIRPACAASHAWTRTHTSSMKSRRRRLGEQGGQGLSRLPLARSIPGWDRDSHVLPVMSLRYRD